MTITYKPYTLRNIREIPQLGNLSEEEKFAIEVVARVFPFKTNNYVLDELIDWNRIPYDPMYVLNFPQRGMLRRSQFNRVADLMRSGAPKARLDAEVREIRMQLNPHPAGQMEANVPTLRGERVEGMQHKYRQTVLFFPSQGQTCHAYCTFCFRWPQFTDLDGLRFATRDIQALVDYLRVHTEVTDVLMTGGDPLTMRSSIIAGYVDALLAADLPHVRTIRFGTKSLAYWPYRYLGAEGADLMRVFERVGASGRHVSLMAHFNHPVELSTAPVREAMDRIRNTGAEVRTQSPLLRHINDDPEAWARMWKAQVNLGLVPYYMFMVRDTGAQHFFGVPLVEAHGIFRDAFREVGGLARTVRGPIMSAAPGKVQVLGLTEVYGRKVLALTMLQGRNPDWVMRPFFAEHDPEALWLDDLRPAFGQDRFFFEEVEDEVSNLLTMF